jgi:YVTN family beta-propeller protein
VIDVATRKHTVILVAAAATLVCAAGVASTVAFSGSRAHTAATAHATLTASSCHGPAGAAYVADPGYQGFTAVDTANCQIVQTYNVDDLQVPGDSGDYNYTGSAAGIALSGTTLWFAVTATDNVAAINTTTLNPDNYNPAETLIKVGYMPEALAVTPDGSQVWVIDSGPQTSTSTLWGISVIDTSTNTVTGHIKLVGDPTDVAFSPNGQDAYVTTSNGLYIYKVANRKQAGFIAGLGSPKSVTAAPNGSAVYVTETSTAGLATISTATDQVVHTTHVGQEPWQAVVSSDGSTVYVANPDSDSVSVVNATTGDVENSYPVRGAPDTLGLTPNGKQLWVAGVDSGVITVINTATGHHVGSNNLGGYGANSGDGLDPTGVVLTATPTPQKPGSSLNPAVRTHRNR